MPTRLPTALALLASCVVALAPAHAGAHLRVAAPVEAPTGEASAWIELSTDTTVHGPPLGSHRVAARRCFLVDPTTLQPCTGLARRASGVRVVVVPMLSSTRIGVALLGRF